MTRLCASPWAWEEGPSTAEGGGKEICVIRPLVREFCQLFLSKAGRIMWREPEQHMKPEEKGDLE